MQIDVTSAEASLDALIERRAREAKQANARAEAWAESARAYHRKCEAERREAWHEHYRHMERLHEQLAAEYREKATALIGAPGGGH